MKPKFTYTVFATIAGLLSAVSPSQGQTDTTNAFDGMSLKELLNVKIVSVSKASESLFETPLSASVVTREAIQKAGCTSIMEALRLVPGMLVREQSNGNYDVQLRGSYTTPNAFFDGSAVTTLVMVDNRPIFNYLKGSTFWETIPVDLNDIEKIEVVRGPAGALYGPNAVNGVINIITRQAAKQGLYATANSSQGSFHTNINNASLGYKTDKWSLIASGNFQHRERTQASYYELWRDRWIDQPTYLVSQLGDTMHDANRVFPYADLSMEKYAGNVFVNYNPSEKTSLNLSAGLQHSLVQKVSAENGYGPMTTSSSDSRYVDIRGNAGQFSGQLSFIDGSQTADYQPGNTYDFHTLDAAVGYNFSFGRLSIKPGVSYRMAVYDDTRYSDTANKSGIFNARGEMATKTASLKSEYKLLNNKLRLVAAVAGNSFTYPEELYLSYEFAATYKLNKKHLLRAVYSSSPRSGAIYDTYVDQTVPGFYPLGANKYFQFRLEGNKDMQLLTVNMLEAGYRGHLAKNFTIDVELFNLRSKNYSNFTMHGSRVELKGTDTVLVIPLSPANLPAEGNQVGTTVSVIYSDRKWDVKPYITVQRSNIKNYIAYSNMPDAPPTYIQPDPLNHNIYSGGGKKELLESAPAVFGGLSVSYKATDKFHVGINAYYLSKQTVYHNSSISFNDGVRGIDHIKSKCIVNANLSWELAKSVRLTADFKNILNDSSREFFKSDEVPFLFIGGIHFEL